MNRWEKYLKETPCVIRNVYNGTYIHKTLFRIQVFYDRKDALKYIRKHGMNEDIYKVVEI